MSGCYYNGHREGVTLHGGPGDGETIIITVNADGNYPPYIKWREHPEPPLLHLGEPVNYVKIEDQLYFVEQHLYKRQLYARGYKTGEADFCFEYQYVEPPQPFFAEPDDTALCRTT